MTLHNPLAFPITPEIWGSHPDFHGMTLRDYFAGQALIAFGPYPCHSDQRARDAYDAADRMLAERAKAVQS